MDSTSRAFCSVGMLKLAAEVHVLVCAYVGDRCGYEVGCMASERRMVLVNRKKPVGDIEESGDRWLLSQVTSARPVELTQPVIETVTDTQL